MSYLNNRVTPLDKKRLSKFFGMSLSNASLPDSIRNLFLMYYIPEEKETYAINNRKEAAFFGLTLMCALNDMEMFGQDSFEERLWMLMKDGSESDKRKIHSLFLSNMTTTAEHIEVLGRVIRRNKSFDKLHGINIDRLISDLIGFGNIYLTTNIKRRWASKIYKMEEEV